MKNNLLFMLAVLGGQLIGCANMVDSAPSLPSKLVRFFELEEIIQFGTEQGDEALRHKFLRYRNRDGVVRYILQRADETGIGVTIYYNGMLFLSWRDADAERRIGIVEIQVVFDDQLRPVRVVSSVEKSRPLPEPNTVPAEEIPIDLPPSDPAKSNKGS